MEQTLVVPHLTIDENFFCVNQHADERRLLYPCWTSIFQECATVLGLVIQLTAAVSAWKNNDCHHINRIIATTALPKVIIHKPRGEVSLVEQDKNDYLFLQFILSQKKIQKKIQKKGYKSVRPIIFFSVMPTGPNLKFCSMKVAHCTT